jgi:hypothetical protein
LNTQDVKFSSGHVAAGGWPRWLFMAALMLAPACQRADTSVTTAETAAEASAGLSEEIWDAFYLQGAKIGYGRTTVRGVTRDGRALVDIRSMNHLEITRFGQRSEQDVTTQTLETPSGEVVEFRTQVALGPSPTIATGRVAGEQMEITVETQGSRQTSRIPWSSDIRGFRAVEQSLAERPLKPGEKRTLKMLVPLVNQVADVELEARDYEKTSILGIEARLLRIDGGTRFPGGEIQSTQWTDERGEVIKTRIAALGQETFRTTREAALASGGSQKAFDLGLDTIVKVDPPLQRPHETREVRYRVELAGGDPLKAFAVGPIQSVRRLANGAAEVTVRSVRGGEGSKPSERAAPLSPEYTSANSILQIDDARVREMAHEAKGGATEPRAIALALERYVHEAVGEKNFSQGFATAAEVAASREGDCTEHAVLLAALLRACGVPSRVAIGLVYVERAGGFGYHMWTEAYLDGTWVPLDAMMGAGGTSAAYLKLADSSLEGAGAYGSFLAVAGVLGNLKVSVIEAK